MRPVGEVEFVQGLAAASASGLYGTSRAAAAIVGHANLNLGERVEPVLEHFRVLEWIMTESKRDWSSHSETDV